MATNTLNPYTLLHLRDKEVGMVFPADVEYSQVTNERIGQRHSLPLGTRVTHEKKTP